MRKSSAPICGAALVVLCSKSCLRQRAGPGNLRPLVNERRTLPLGDRTSEQERAVRRIQTGAVVVVVVIGLASRPLEKVAPDEWWATLSLVLAVIAVNVAIATVLIARVLKITVMTV